MNGALNLPTNVLIATIRKYRDQLNERFERIKNGTNDSSSLPVAIEAKPSSSFNVVKKRRPTKIIPLKSYRERTNFEKVVVSIASDHNHWLNIYILSISVESCHLFVSIIAAISKRFPAKS